LNLPNVPGTESPCCDAHPRDHDALGVVHVVEGEAAAEDEAVAEAAAQEEGGVEGEEEAAEAAESQQTQQSTEGAEAEAAQQAQQNELTAADPALEAEEAEAAQNEPAAAAASEDADAAEAQQAEQTQQGEAVQATQEPLGGESAEETADEAIANAQEQSEDGELSDEIPTEGEAEDELAAPTAEETIATLKARVSELETQLAADEALLHPEGDTEESPEVAEEAEAEAQQQGQAQSDVPLDADAAAEEDVVPPVDPEGDIETVSVQDETAEVISNLEGAEMFVRKLAKLRELNRRR